ncbi:hypothetical protein R3P38DRAFT_2764956 [Favolaschia claudopus]|uniref:Uncharacterized protein n=1 Tax=Favolaschia claudopus TaxID=2862362 RepID=A0AAW0DGF4_9AGAR
MRVGVWNAVLVEETGDFRNAEDRMTELLHRWRGGTTWEWRPNICPLWSGRGRWAAVSASGPVIPHVKREGKVNGGSLDDATQLAWPLDQERGVGNVLSEPRGSCGMLESRYLYVGRAGMALVDGDEGGDAGGKDGEGLRIADAELVKERTGGGGGRSTRRRVRKEKRRQVLSAEILKVISRLWLLGLSYNKTRIGSDPNLNPRRRSSPARSTKRKSPTSVAGHSEFRQQRQMRVDVGGNDFLKQ